MSNFISHAKEKHGLRVLKNRLLRGVFGCRGKEVQEAEEDCIMRSIITFMLQQILLG
jgi:hypothetical protein